MYSVEESVSFLSERAKIIASTDVLNLADAHGKVLAEDIVSRVDVPPTDNSAMDGYVIKLGGNETEYPISQRISAGQVTEVLRKGTAARIFTGAEIPEGADTVVMQENCREENGVLIIDMLPARGSNIRKQGQDIKQNNIILTKGTRLQAQHIGLIASIGINQLTVYKPLKIAVLSTGNELVEPGVELQKGQIYNSNRPMIMSICKSWGMDVLDFNIVQDNLAETENVLMQAAKKADIIITSGGVSVGDEDHVKQAVKNRGELNLWKIAMKPGKPFAFGYINKVPFIGLPGNPSSAFVTLLIIARAFILKTQGLINTKPVIMSAVSSFDRKIVKRQEYLRAKLSDGKADIYANQSSGVLSSVCWGNCFVIQKTDQGISKGQSVEVLPFSELVS